MNFDAHDPPRVFQVADDRLIDPAVARSALRLPAAHQRANPNPSFDQFRHNMAGKTACRANHQHPHSTKLLFLIPGELLDWYEARYE